MIFKKKILVTMSNTQLKKIDRINTWLTCTVFGCPSANGSNNILYKGDLEFTVQLRRDAALTDQKFTPKDVKDAGFVIHYEVQGPCP